MMTFGRASMERELSDVMSMLPRLDYSDPVAARSEMNRFVRLSTMLGSHTLTDSEVDVVDRICPANGTSTVRVRLYVPRDLVKPAAAVIYFHGGAFVLGDLEIEHPRCLEMAKETKAVGKRSFTVLHLSIHSPRQSQTAMRYISGPLLKPTNSALTFPALPLPAVVQAAHLPQLWPLCPVIVGFACRRFSFSCTL